MVPVKEFLYIEEEWCLLEDWVRNMGFWSELSMERRMEFGGVLEAFGDGSMCVEREVVFHGELVCLRKSYLRRGMLQNMFYKLN
jgi:hypothetical protein